MVFIGRNDQSPCLPEGLPYQHEGSRDLLFIGRCQSDGSLKLDFTFPKVDRSKGNRLDPTFTTWANSGRIDDLVRNIHAFQPLLSAFTYQRSKRNSGLESRVKKVLSEDMQRAVFDQMKQIISAEPINYFILERINAVVLLIESMEYHDEEIQVRDNDNMRKETVS